MALKGTYMYDGPEWFLIFLIKKDMIECSHFIQKFEMSIFFSIGHRFPSYQNWDPQNYFVFLSFFLGPFFHNCTRIQQFIGYTNWGIPQQMSITIWCQDGPFTRSKNAMVNIFWRFIYWGFPPQTHTHKHTYTHRQTHTQYALVCFSRPPAGEQLQPHRWPVSSLMPALHTSINDGRTKQATKQWELKARTLRLGKRKNV